jgi:glycerophosphoryl diester phosphodiesterase
MLRELLGHRGAAFEAPENTMAGFAHAWKAGVRSFELDVRLSADDQLIVLHDENLSRTTGLQGRVGDFTASQLAEMDARCTCPDWPEKTGIPCLEEVLERYARELKTWEIEIKADMPARLEILCRKLVSTIERYGIAERAVVTSFDPTALEIMTRLAPEQRRGFISNFNQPEHLETALRLGCFRICIPLHHSNKKTARGAHAAGLNLTGWLGDSEDAIDTLLDWEVDAITSNRPSLALHYLHLHGLLQE